VCYECEVVWGRGEGGEGVKTVGAQHVKNADSCRYMMVGAVESRELHGWLDLHFLGLCSTLLFVTASALLRTLEQRLMFGATRS
jgi:hypothetical protein